MRKSDQPVISSATLIFAIGPIFLINLLLPFISDQQSYTFDHFINQYLFGDIGVWSSRFTLSSKATANYIATFGPIFSALIFYKCCKATASIKKRANAIPLAKYTAMLTVMISLFAFFTYQAYFSHTNLMTQAPRLRALGTNLLLYSIFSSTILLSILFLPVFVFQLTLFVPCRLLRLMRKR